VALAATASKRGGGGGAGGGGGGGGGVWRELTGAGVDTDLERAQSTNRGTSVVGL